MDGTGTSDYTLSGPADMANTSTLWQQRPEKERWEGSHDNKVSLESSSFDPFSYMAAGQ